MKETRTIITVDGVGASGKSALARLLAERLGFAHLNSGLLYRAAALLVNDAGIDPEDEAAVSDLLPRHSIQLSYIPETGTKVLVDGKDREGELNSESISRIVSPVAKQPFVREYFNKAQREAFAPMSVVAEGRDMGTVIFPDAPIKFFIQADLRVRAERRQAQLAAKGEVVSVETIAQDLDRRDTIDSQRAVAPMKAADGAVLIDNSQGTLEDAVERMFQVVAQRSLRA
jgi:cytidylate kinase